MSGIDKPLYGPYDVGLMDDPLSTARVLVDIQEGDRRIIARELHDRLGQSLAVLKLLLGDALSSSPDKARYTLGEAQSLINEMMSLARELSLELRPKMLDDLGLLPALLYLFESFTSRTHVAVQFEHQGLHKKIPPETGLAAYRIVKEALENVAAHAGTEEARVRVWSDRWILAVRIEDSGRGFEADEAAKGWSGGIGGMRGRALIMGGRFSLTSTPGKGTVVAAELPLPVRSRRVIVE